MNVLAILQRARARIASPANWLRRLDSANQHGCRVDPKHPSACRFCLLGAIQAECDSRLEVDVVCNWVIDTHNPTHAIVSYNDSHTHTEVLAAIDRAIERVAQ